MWMLSPQIYQAFVLSLIYLLASEMYFPIAFLASLTRWTWVSVNSGSWWWTGRPGVLQFMGSQRVGHDWATDLIWSDSILGPVNKTETWSPQNKISYKTKALSPNQRSCFCSSFPFPFPKRKDSLLICPFCICSYIILTFWNGFLLHICITFLPVSSLIRGTCACHFYNQCLACCLVVLIRCICSTNAGWCKFNWICSSERI